MLADNPLAARYAEAYADRYHAGTWVSPEAFRRHAAPHVVRLAVQGVATACIPAPHDILRAMLVEGIRICRPPAEPTVVDADAWVTACELTLR